MWVGLPGQPPGEPASPPDVDDNGLALCGSCERRYLPGTHGGECGEAKAHNREAALLAEEVGGELVIASTGVPIVVFPGDRLEVA